jgi:hypothetical protein
VCTLPIRLPLAKWQIELRPFELALSHTEQELIHAKCIVIKLPPAETESL